MKRCVEAKDILVQREAGATGETEPSTYDKEKNLLQKRTFPVFFTERIL